MSIIDDRVTRVLDLNMVDEEYLVFPTITNDQMSSSMNDEDQRKIEEIEIDLINSVKKCSNSSIFTSNTFSQENFGGTNKMEKQQQFELIDNDYKEPEQISSNTNTTIDDVQHFDNINENNDNTNTGEQLMNALQYCRQLLEKLTLAVNTWEPALVNLAIPAKTGDYYLKTLPIPSPNEINVIAQDPLNKLSNLLRTGIDLLPSFRQISNTDSVNHTVPMGEESNESSERVTSAPSEHNGSHMNQEIQASTQSKLSTSTIPKDAVSVALSLSLSQLLSQAKTIVHDLKLAELKIVEQPQPFWKKRTINCLKNKWCPAIQGRSGKQRHGIGIQWSELTNCNWHNLFIFVQLLSHDEHPHPSNILVPEGTRVKQSKSLGKKKNKNRIRSKLDDLDIDRNRFDRKTKTILCPLTENEYRQCKKNLKVIMFSLYETSEEMTNSDDAQHSTNNEETDENEEDEEYVSIEDELRKLCKFRICLCRQTNKGELEYVSNFIDTELIEQSKGSKSLAIDPSKVTPISLCKCGNETITVLLNTDSEKSGFVVRLNNTPLDFHQVYGVTKKQIFFNSRPHSTSGQNYLNVKVSKKSISETIKQNLNPYDGLVEELLVSVNLHYLESESDNPHEHKDTKLVEQSH